MQFIECFKYIWNIHKLCNPNIFYATNHVDHLGCVIPLCWCNEVDFNNVTLFIIIDTYLLYYTPLWQRLTKRIWQYIPITDDRHLIEILGGVGTYPTRKHVTLMVYSRWAKGVIEIVAQVKHVHDNFGHNEITGTTSVNTLRPRQMDAISQTTFSSAFSWKKMFEFLLKFHWSMFLRVELTIFQHWFR